MTNMEGWVYIFLSLFIGIPLLCVILIACYLIHRRNLKKEDTDAPNALGSDRLGIIQSIRQISLAPDHFFKQITGNGINLWQPFVWLTVGGALLGVALIFSTGLGLAGGSGLFLMIVFLPLLLIPLYIFWILSAVSLYILTFPLKGDGKIETILQNSGYGIAFGLFLMALVYIILAIPITVLNLHFIGGGGGSDPVASAVYLITFGASAIIVLWSAGLISIGLRYARNISIFRAAALVYTLAIAVFVWLYQTYLIKMIGPLLGY